MAITLPPQTSHKNSFDLEPNPFEHSFRHTTNDDDDDADDESIDADDADDNDDKSSKDARRQNSSTRPTAAAAAATASSTTPKPTLPPLAAITSPSDQSYNWAFSSAGIANSLRSGPLSPAMLPGPQPQSHSNAVAHNIQAASVGAQVGGPSAPLAFSFDPTAAFRTGLTPSTGLTPLVGPVAFPPPSPNTAAFLAMVGSGTAAVTPNTLSALTSVLQSQSAAPSSAAAVSLPPNNTSHALPHPQTAQAPTGAVAPSATVAPPETASSSTSARFSSYGPPAAAAAAAANGLFLLSQAHQELAKREEAQKQQAAAANNAAAAAAAASASTAGMTTRRGAKRKSDAAAAVVAASSTASLPTLSSTAKPPANKRSRTSRAGAARRGSVAVSSTTGDGDDNDIDDIDDGLDDSDIPDPAVKSDANNLTGSAANKKPETEEEKRKNFLERNRQAALKCRQRKKQWLTSLQAKNEYLTNENERLSAALVASREEIARLSALVGAGGVGLPHSMGGSMQPAMPVAVGAPVSMMPPHQQHHHMQPPQHHRAPSSSAGSVSSQHGVMNMNGNVNPSANSFQQPPPPSATLSSSSIGSLRGSHQGSPVMQQQQMMTRSPASEGRSSRGSLSYEGSPHQQHAGYQQQQQHAYGGQTVAVGGRGYGY